MVRSSVSGRTTEGAPCVPVAPAPSISTPERLAYWYFRLNGFLTTENFIVHPDSGRDQRTDADLLAVRFSHRRENLERPMKDDSRVAGCRTPINLVIAEVKTGLCALNGPWTNPEAMNMKRVLRAIGCLPDEALELSCAQLYSHGIWADSMVTLRLFALGDRRARGLCIPDEQQVTWDEVIAFCVERFKAYRNPKSSVGQWEDDGRRLMTAALGSEANPSIRRIFGLPDRPVEQVEVCGG